MRNIMLIAHNLRSTHNIGSLLRTAEGLGITKLYITGYSPYPIHEHDVRLPHIAQKLDAAIHKTALEAEKLIDWEYVEDVFTVLSLLKGDGYTLCALEQTPSAVSLPDFKVPDKCALLLGSEVTGVPPELLEIIETHLVIPMYGKKESFNVVQAAAMALYHFRFHPN